MVDADSRRLTRAGELLSIPDRHLGVLLELLARRGSVVSKDALIEAVWQDVAVTDNSLEQAVSALRRPLGTGPDGQPVHPDSAAAGLPLHRHRSARLRRAPATKRSRSCWRRIAHGLKAAPRLKRSSATRSFARGMCSKACSNVPSDHAPAHIGLANACIMQFEMTRADERPDVAALEAATTAFTRSLSSGTRVRRSVGHARIRARSHGSPPRCAGGNATRGDART